MGTGDGRTRSALISREMGCRVALAEADGKYGNSAQADFKDITNGNAGASLRGGEIDMFFFPPVPGRMKGEIMPGFKSCKSTNRQCHWFWHLAASQSRSASHPGVLLSSAAGPARAAGAPAVC